MTDRPRPVDDGDAVARQVSVADWTAGYEAGWTAGYYAARTALDDAATHLATTLRPARAVELAQARRRPGVSAHQEWRTEVERTDYTRRVHASWGLPPPEHTNDSHDSDDSDDTAGDGDRRSCPLNVTRSGENR